MKKLTETNKTLATNPDGYYVKADKKTGEIITSGSEADDLVKGRKPEEDDEEDEEEKDESVRQFLTNIVTEMLQDIEVNNMADLKESLVGGERDNVHQENPAGNETGAPGGNFRQMLAAELFGSAAFSHELPANDMTQGQVNMQLDQAEDGLGNLRGAKEQVTEQIKTNLAMLTADLFRQDLVTEAASVAELSNTVDSELGKKLLSLSFGIKETAETEEILEMLYQTVHLTSVLKD